MIILFFPRSSALLKSDLWLRVSPASNHYLKFNRVLNCKTLPIRRYLRYKSVVVIVTVINLALNFPCNRSICLYSSCSMKYLNIIKFYASLILVPLIFALLKNPYTCARIIFAHWQNLYFCVGLSYDRKYSVRQCVKYAEIRTSCIWTEGKYGYDSAQTRENNDQRKPVFRHTSRSERTEIGC